ncbi:ROK family protein [Pseudooceanicola onchidii]|uniref:glucokinase n=1 Tax=Pseudooceanicola onchidii TaxID=2562279 RepID=UPI0010A9F57E|nr:ROK family protein [Pseudooceanicola onchidii]
MQVIADIGGTNARLALVGPDGMVPDSVRSYRNAGFARFDDLLTAYLAEVGQVGLTRLVVAVAGPVKGDSARLTNLDWTLSVPDLAAAFGAEVRIINDLTALGYASPALRPDQLRPLVAGAAVARGQALVVGIGTGFNVSPVIPLNPGVICPGVEAGHASLPSACARALDHAMPGLSDSFPTVEDLFSGRGLQALVSAHSGGEAAALVSSHGQGNAEGDAVVDLFARLIGLLLRDLSMLYLPTGGLYLAGGVARSVLSTAAARECAAILTAPSRFLAGPIPAWLIVEDAAALTGCAAVARQAAG